MHSLACMKYIAKPLLHIKILFKFMRYKTEHFRIYCSIEALQKYETTLQIYFSYTISMLKIVSWREYFMT